MADNGRPDEEPDFGREGFGPEADFGPESEEVDPNDPRFSSKWSKANGKSHGFHNAKGKPLYPHIPLDQLEPIHTWGELDTRSLIAWMFRELVEASCLLLISGAQGTGKTFLLIDILCSIISGMPFGKFETERTGGVLVVIPEYPGQLRPRMMAMIEAKLKPWYAMQGSEMPPLPIKWVEACDDLATDIGQAKIYNTIVHTQAQMRTEFGVDLVAVFIDTSSAATPSYDPNDTGETIKLYAKLSKLRMATNTVIEIIDHHGKDPERGTTGSAAKEQKLDTVLYAREVANSKFEMFVKKVRNGPRGYSLAFELIEMVLPGIVDDKKQPIRSMTVRWLNGGDDGPGKKKNNRGAPPKHLDAVLNAINKALNEKGERRMTLDAGERNTVEWDLAEDFFFQISGKLTSSKKDERKAANRIFRNTMNNKSSKSFVRFQKLKTNGEFVAYVWLPHGT